MTKRKLRRKLRRVEKDLTIARLGPTRTYETVMVCFEARTVEYRGKVITTESDCLTFPVPA